MRLLITDPTSVVTDQPDVLSLRAEDESGSFGILPGHAAFLTVLAVSVVSWRCADDKPGFCAVSGGVLRVSNGQQISIATRQAVLADTLATLEPAVVERLRAEHDGERNARVATLQLHTRAIREIMRRLDAGASGSFESRQ